MSETTPVPAAEALPLPNIGWLHIGDLEKAERLLRRAIHYLGVVQEGIKHYDASADRVALYDRIGQAHAQVIEASAEIAGAVYLEGRALRNQDVKAAGQTYAEWVAEGNARNWDDGGPDPDPDPAQVPFE